MPQTVNIQYQSLRLMPNDQMNLEHQQFSEPDKPGLIVVAELKQEANHG
tara:strand:+ start:481 stop:627 length:147 start_codon:yes stop_codon:yes gene_type:complete